MDTGNSVEDIFGGGEVIIADGEYVKTLFGEIDPALNREIRSRYRVMPCGTVTGGGTLEAFRCDTALVSDGKRNVRLNKPILAVSKTPLKDDYAAMLIKSALRDLLFCVIGLEKHYVDQPPPVAFPPLVPHDTKGGISFARQGGWPVFPRPQGGCMVLIYDGAEGAVPRQRSDTIYLPRARALNPPVRRSRSQAEPLAPRAKGPAAPSTLTPVRACQPSGIQFPAANATTAPKRRKRQSPHEPCLFLHSERTCRASDYNSLPTIGASCFSRPMRSSKVSGVMDSAPSHHACSGSL